MRIEIESSQGDLNDINMTPFIDVMLVLLIMFMITLPVMQHSTAIELPQVSNQESQASTQDIQISLQRDGQWLWNEQALNDDDQLWALLQETAAGSSQQEQQPAILIYADKEAQYEGIAKLLAHAQRSGLYKLRFMTEPN